MYVFLGPWAVATRIDFLPIVLTDIYSVLSGEKTELIGENMMTRGSVVSKV